MTMRRGFSVTNAAVERRLLQGAVGIGALVPILAGLSGAFSGVVMVATASVDPALDSHYRYLSGLLLAIGLAFWSMVPRIEGMSGRFRLLTVIVFVGGLARGWGVLHSGVPAAPMLAALAMELVVTPLLCLWQARVAHRTVAATPPS